METLQIDDSRLELAVRAATQAGSRAKSVKLTTTPERKENNTIVTEADREAETIVRDILQAESDHPILGEEHGGNIANTDTYWVVDPIDGTRNFSYEQPFYGSAIGLVEDGEPTVGVWYMPEFDYLFYAVSGFGAYRGTTRLHVTDKRDVSSAYPSLSGKGQTKIYPIITEMTADSSQQVGSAVMAEAWVAAGWCDFGIFGALAPWDMVVGTVLVREAGGVMKSVSSGRDAWGAVSGGHVVFGNEALVDAVRDRLSADEIRTIEQTEYDW